MSNRLITASDLARARFPGVQLAGAYGDLLGSVAPDAQVLVWGGPGSGKSTFSLGLAAEWARRVGPTLYVSAEEGVSKALADRARRLKATPRELTFAVYDPAAGLAGVLDDVRRSGASLVVLDSLTWVDPSSRAFGAFAADLREAGVALVTIAHQRKAGGYRGNADVGHAVDVVVQVDGGAASTVKSRFAPLTSVDVPFTAARANPAPDCSCRSCLDCGGSVRTNPAHNGACAHARGSVCECSCGGRLHGSGVTRVRGAAKTAGRQSAQGRAVMASLTERGTKKVRAVAAPKPVPKKSASKKSAAPKRAPKKRTAAPKPAPTSRKAGAAKRSTARKAPARRPSGVAAQLAAVRRQINSL